MRRPTHAVDVELEVPFHDVDALRVVWHGHYAKYAEIGRTALLRSKGLDMADLERTGNRTVVIETHCRYSYPLRYGDRLRVSSWLDDVEHRVKIDFEMTNLTAGRRSAHGHTILASLDSAGNLLFLTPEQLVQRLS